MRANKASTTARRAARRAAPSDRERLRGAVPELGGTHHFIALILETQSFHHMLWLFAGIEQSVSGLPPRLASSRVVVSLSTAGRGRHRRLARVLPIVWKAERRRSQQPCCTPSHAVSARRGHGRSFSLAPAVFETSSNGQTHAATS